ncbi:hypothetical protein [Microbulbifer elongatus]|uniref:hypothetical protein n=1 Tax=Microbulbifer elongatus TaxID=86173 RepID=UPI001CFE2875|nr:hypothetical protein [Microbulbifer elongatus]
MKKYLALLILGFCVNAVADENFTINVNESSFSINGSPKIFDAESLYKELQKEGLESVILAIDACAGPVQVADGYVVLKKLNINKIELKGLGTIEPGECSNV